MDKRIKRFWLQGFCDFLNWPDENIPDQIEDDSGFRKIALRMAGPDWRWPKHTVLDRQTFQNLRNELLLFLDGGAGARFSFNRKTCFADVPLYVFAAVEKNVDVNIPAGKGPHNKPPQIFLEKRISNGKYKFFIDSHDFYLKVIINFSNALGEVTTARAIHKCADPRCAKWFVKFNTKRKIYCGETCGERVRKRRFRAKKAKLKKDSIQNRG